MIDHGEMVAEEAGIEEVTLFDGETSGIAEILGVGRPRVLVEVIFAGCCHLGGMRWVEVNIFGEVKVLFIRNDSD